MRIRHNLEQQIQARNQSGVTEDQLKEFSMMFRHFDKDKSGKLSHDEFKSCLRALGYDLPIAEEEGDGAEPEFDAILATVDPNKDGSIHLQDYMVCSIHLGPNHFSVIFYNFYFLGFYDFQRN